MENYDEKIGLLQEMIAFALVDGELHDRVFLQINSNKYFWLARATIDRHGSSRPPGSDRTGHFYQRRERLHHCQSQGVWPP